LLRLRAYMVWQKILMDTRVTVMTTKTIMSSFCRKYAALCKLDERLLRRLFAFQPGTRKTRVMIYPFVFNICIQYLYSRCCIHDNVFTVL
jgi:hypothetical protein